MNEINVANIAAYLQQHPEVATDVLIKSCLNAGYSEEECKTALARLNRKLPHFLKKQEIQKGSLKHSLTFRFLILFIIISLSIAAYLWYLVLNPSSQTSPVKIGAEENVIK